MSLWQRLGWAALLGAAVGALVWGLAPHPPLARADNCPQELIQRVNALRAQNGLPPYQTNAILMSVAQAHSEYQASIHQGTHIGPYGDHPRDRVRAAGYGGGAPIFVSENIAWGSVSHATPAWAVQLWTQDAPHLNTMLGSYHDVGAGCASDGNMIYFTLDAAAISGSAPAGGDEATTPVPTRLPVIPVVVATPNPDGSVIHVVRSGQTLLQIALAYDVPLETLLELNGLTEDSVIYPGQEIVIHPGLTATPTVTPTWTPSPSPSPTVSAIPTRTADPTATGAVMSPTVGVTPTSGSLAEAEADAAGGAKLVLWGLIGALLAGGLAYGGLALLDRWDQR